MDLKKYATTIQHSLIAKLANRYVSILIDGVKRYWKNYEGVILYTQQKLYFLSLIEIPNATSLTLSHLITEIVQYLAVHKIIVEDQQNWNLEIFNDPSSPLDQQNCKISHVL